MSERWKRRSQGPNWYEFGIGEHFWQLSLFAQERSLEAIKEVRLGKTFCLGLLLTLPIDSTLMTVGTV